MSKLMLEEIKKRRKALGFSQEELAHRSGISYRALQNYETGKTSIPIDRLEAIAGVLGCYVSDLYMDRDSPEKKASLSYALACDVLTQLKNITPLHRAVVLAVLFRDEKYHYDTLKQDADKLERALSVAREGLKHIACKEPPDNYKHDCCIAYKTESDIAEIMGETPT